MIKKISGPILGLILLNSCNENKFATHQVALQLSESEKPEAGPCKLPTMRHIMFYSSEINSLETIHLLI